MIEVSGYLEEILIDTNDVSLIEDPDELVLSLVDTPIMMNGEVVGVINEIDLNMGMWYGVIWNKIRVNIDQSLGTIATSVAITNERGKEN